MRRPDLLDLPDNRQVPLGAVLRRAKPEDAESIGKVLAPAFEMEWTVADVFRELLGHEEVSETFVVELDGRIVATASYQLQSEYPNSGWVHWVAALKQYRGQSLGRTVTLAVLQAGKADGKRDAYLTTDDFRLPAIKTYLDLQFEPDSWDPSHSERWEAVFRTLGSRPTPAR